MTDTDYDVAVKEMIDLIHNASKAHRADIDHISRTALAWADDYNLKDDWNVLVEELNENLKYDLQPAVRSYRVYKTYTVKIRMDVDATDEEHAEEIADQDGVSFYVDSSWEIIDEDYESTRVEED